MFTGQYKATKGRITKADKNFITIKLSTGSIRNYLNKKNFVKGDLCWVYYDYITSTIKRIETLNETTLTEEKGEDGEIL